MKRFFAAILCSVLVPFMTPAHASEDTNVTILVKSHSGVPVSDGYSSIASTFLNETKILTDGAAKFKVPNGVQKFTLATVANPLDENLSYYTFYWDMTVSGQTQVELVLPKVTSTTIRVDGASAKPHVMVFRLGSYDSRSTESASWYDSSGTWATLRQNGTASQVHGTRLSIKQSARDVNGQPVQVYRSSNEAGEVLVEGGSIQFSIFETKPLVSEESWRIRTQDTFDFDGDGYTDFSYGYRYGAYGWKSGRFSRASVFSDNAGFPVEGSVTLAISPLPRTGKLDANKRKSFRVEGELESLDMAFFSVNSPITAYVINKFAFDRSVRATAVGSATVNSDGTFALDVLIQSNVTIVGTTFFLRTPLGYGTVNLELPTFETKIVRQKTLSPFQSSSTALTAKQKTEIRDTLNSSPSAEKFICTGIRFETAPMSENIVVRKRAKAACDYAKTLNPALSTFFQNKPTKARSYAGKVLLTIKD
jgi:hypothetical protein